MSNKYIIKSMNKIIFGRKFFFMFALSLTLCKRKTCQNYVYCQYHSNNRILIKDAVDQGMSFGWNSINVSWNSNKMNVDWRNGRISYCHIKDQIFGIKVKVVQICRKFWLTKSHWCSVKYILKFDYGLCRIVNRERCENFTFRSEEY